MRDTFFKKIKDNLFHSLSQAQVDGLNLILDEADKRKTPLKQLAYILATTYHETGTKMEPIKEIGGPNYFTKMYDVKGSRPKLARDNGNTNPGDGAKYFGRGYVQITWKNNYEKFDKKLNLGGKLVSDPDTALEKSVALDIMFIGMEQGLFTGKKLSDYINATSTDYVGARRIINGADKAKLISEYAKQFEDALND